MNCLFLYTGIEVLPHVCLFDRLEDPTEDVASLSAEEFVSRERQGQLVYD
ncbi:hypothetical protein [Gryllotalpicola reticulitermitis]